LTATLQLETPRLILRRWQDRDREPFAAMNADPVVMTYFAAPMTRAESDEGIDRYNMQLDRDGFTMFAAEHAATGDLVGILGMQTMRDAVPNLPQPAVEIGWRLRRDYHGQGLATEGARAVINFAFSQLHLAEVVAITAEGNAASRHVMQKLGMTHRPELTFDHPRVPSGHPHQRHALYSLSSILYSLSPEVLCSTPS
jgi:RimJ/RimL family protein N-acetyltransferase